MRQTPLRAPKASISLIEDSVNAPQKNAAQNVEVLIPTRLNPTVRRAVAEVLEGEVAGFDLEELVADGKSDFGQS